MFSSGADHVGENLFDSFLFFSYPFWFPSCSLLFLFITYLHSTWEMRIQQSPFNVVIIEPEQDKPGPTEGRRMNWIKHEEIEYTP